MLEQYEMDISKRGAISFNLLLNLHLDQKSDLQDLLSNLGNPSHYVQGLNMKGCPLLLHKAEQYHQLCIKSRLNEKGDIIQLT